MLNTVNNIGVVSLIRPSHSVPRATRYMNPVGTEIASVVVMKGIHRTADTEANMWWTHTVPERNAMARKPSTAHRYPNSVLRAMTGITSSQIPQAPSMMMYTSGCPNSQKRSCQRSGAPCALKKLVWRSRSITPITNATPITGTHSTFNTAVTSWDHTNTGSLFHVRPGARMYTVVAMTLMAVRREDTPRLNTPR